MKKRSELKVGDTIISFEKGGARNEIPTKITDIDKKHGIIEMGLYGCSYNDVQYAHMFISESGEYIDIFADDEDIEIPLPSVNENN